MTKHKYWSVDNTEVMSRLKEVRNKIYRAKKVDKILGKLDSEKPNLFSHLDLIYLLINDNSDEATVFWDAFVNAQSHFLQINPIFDIKQLSNLLDIVDKNHKEQNDHESEKLLSDLKQFISINGLIEKSSSHHYTNATSLANDGSGIGIADIKEDYKKTLINKYKAILFDGVLLLHGITPTWYSRYDFINSSTPNIKIRESLANHGVVRNLDFLNEDEASSILSYRGNRNKKSYVNHIDTYITLTREEAADLYDSGNGSDMAEGEWDGYRDHFIYEKTDEAGLNKMNIEIDTLRNFTTQSLESINEINLFIKLLNNFDYRSSEISKSLDFENFLESSGKVLNCEIPDNFKNKINNALEILSNILNARCSLEEAQHSFEAYVVGPYGSDDHHVPYHLDQFDPNTHLNHLQIKIEELAYIANSKEIKSIRNEIIKEDTLLKSGSESNCVTIFSARDWLKDPKRKYKFYELIKINELTEEKITLDFLKNMTD